MCCVVSRFYVRWEIITLISKTFQAGYLKTWRCLCYSIKILLLFILLIEGSKYISYGSVDISAFTVKFLVHLTILNSGFGYIVIDKCAFIYISVSSITFSILSWSKFSLFFLFFFNVSLFLFFAYFFPFFFFFRKGGL